MFIFSKKAFSKLLIICSVLAGSLHATYNTNFFRPYDVAFKLAQNSSSSFTAGATLEHGLRTEDSFDTETNQTGLFKAYSPTQSVQAMLADPVITFLSSENPERFFISTLQPTFDGSWGTFDVKGKFQETNVTIWMDAQLPMENHLPGRWSVKAYLPIKSLRVEDTTWTDKTDKFKLGNEEIITNITGRLKDFVNQVGALDLDNWNKIGQGDFSTHLCWNNEYQQDGDVLQNAKINVSVGVTVPTARTIDSDINKVFAIPLGAEAWGVPIHAGLELFFNKSSSVKRNLSAGIEVDFAWHADTTKVRRLKTNPEQTEYLLLSKGRATLQHGKAWRFNLFAQDHNIFDGLFISGAYHFLKISDHHLVAEDPQFSDTIINTSERYKERSSHDLVGQVYYQRPSSDDSKSAFTTPCISGFIKYPISGRRISRNVTLGGTISFAF